ncbi:MAG: Crp/Fnr family transcriptional regulator [Burkholderiales bacterium]
MEHYRVHLLQRMPIFGAIKAQTLEVFLRHAVDVRIPAGDSFFREADAADAMFVLERGRVSVVKRWKGRDYSLWDLGAGDCFGEMALIDLFPRSASVVALEDCSAIRLTNADLYRVYETDVEQFALIQMNIARELSRRLRIADERLFRFRLEPAIRDEDVGGHFSI